MVAKPLLPEVLEMISRWVPEHSKKCALLVDLTKTRAYEKNKSFRNTINGLLLLVLRENEGIRKDGKETKCIATQ